MNSRQPKRKLQALLALELVLRTVTLFAALMSATYAYMLIKDGLDETQYVISLGITLTVCVAAFLGRRQIRKAL